MTGLAASADIGDRDTCPTMTKSFPILEAAWFGSASGGYASRSSVCVIRPAAEVMARRRACAKPAMEGREGRASDPDRTAIGGGAMGRSRRRHAGCGLRTRRRATARRADGPFAAATVLDRGCSCRTGPVRRGSRRRQGAAARGADRPSDRHPEGEDPRPWPTMARPAVGGSGGDAEGRIGAGRTGVRGFGSRRRLERGATRSGAGASTDARPTPTTCSLPRPGYARRSRTRSRCRCRAPCVSRRRAGRREGAAL